MRLLLPAFLAAGVLYVLWQARALWFLLLWSAFLAYLITPLAARLERLGLRRTVAALLVMVALLGGLVVLAVVSLPVLAREGGSLLRYMPPRLGGTLAFFGGLRQRLLGALPAGLERQASLAWAGVERQLVTAGVGAARHVWEALPGLLGLFLGPVVAFYLVADRARLLEALFAFFPPEEEERLRDLLWRLDRSLGGFLRGQLLVAVGVGLLAGLTAWAFHLGFALFVGVVAGVTEVIPYVGPILGAIPAVALAALRGPATVVSVILAFVAIHQIEGGILSPLIVGGEMGLTPLAILLALFVGGEVGGLLGLLVAVPATGALVTLASWVYERLVSPSP